MKIRHSSVIKSKVRLDQVHLTQAPLVKQKSPLDHGVSEITTITEPDRILTTTSRVPARFRPIPAARALVLPLLLCLGSAPIWAQQKDQQQMRGLDEQVQEIKSDVLNIAAELNQLEEKLLYPSDTQVAVFVALSKGDQLRLDAVRIQIDGQLVAHYIYSFKELDALRKGGVQRIYVGNVPTGDHKLEVVVDGKLESGADFSRTERFTFHKEVKPKLVGLTLAGSGNTPIALGEW
jgi:hypothetical protein